jgi:hypothetical protein
LPVQGVVSVIKWLTEGKWERPHDKMAVYTEIKPGDTWGIRVTLLGDSARVEAINGPKCSYYKPDPKYSAEVRPVTWLERLRGVTFDDKLRAEVERKRAVAAHENAELVAKPTYFRSQKPTES